MSEPEALAPTRIGELEVIRRIGAGGFGAVFLAADRRLDRRVALKLAHPGRGDLWREARAAARLAHPNVVTIFEIGDHAGTPYLVMEYVDGPTLRERLAQDRIPRLEALRIARDLAAAIEAAHREGIMHLDLTPANVLLAPDGRARVVDFGLARASDTHAFATGSPGAGPLTSVAGTPAYMAPEQWRCELVGPAADLWALGTLLHVLATGRPPVEGTSARIRELVASPTELELAPALAGSPLAAIVRRCLRKDPARRPAAADVAAELATIFDEARDREAPFCGLVPLDAQHGYAGRAELVASLLADLDARRSLLLTGGDGAGKTSLVQAALVPALRARGWRIARVEPAVDVLAQIAAALRHAMPGAATATRVDDEAARSPAEQRARWTATPELFAADLADAAAAVGGALALVLDPLDAVPAGERPALLAALAAAIADGGDARLVLVARTVDAGLAAAVDRHIALAPPSCADLAEMLARPLRDAGAPLADDDARAIAADLAGCAAPLALVQLVGLALWEARDREHRTAPPTARAIAGALLARHGQIDHARLRAAPPRIAAPRASPPSRAAVGVAVTGLVAAAIAAVLVVRPRDAARPAPPPTSPIAAPPSGPQCEPYYFPHQRILTAFNDDAIQDALAAISYDGTSMLVWRRDCNHTLVFTPVLVDLLGETPVRFDLTAHPALQPLKFAEEGFLTMTADARTIIGTNRDATALFAITRSGPGVVDFTAPDGSAFANLVEQPPFFVMHPLISADGLELHYVRRNRDDRDVNILVSTTRASTRDPFPPATPLPGHLISTSYASGISADRRTLFLRAGYATEVWSRDRLDQPFANPNAPTAAPLVPGFRTRPVGACDALVGTCIGGCMQEQTCEFAR